MAIMLEVRPDASEREQIYHLKEQLEVYLNAQEDITKKVINATKGEKGDPGPPGPKGDPGSGGGTGDYNDLTNKPQIEGVALEGNKTASNLGLVPETRKVNNKSLSADITLTANDVSALPSSTTIPSPGTGSSYPVMDGTRALGSDAGYARVDHVHPSDTSRVPTSRTVNGHALSSNVTVNASEVPYTPPTGITADDVAEALTDIYSNMLNPEEILEELGRKVDKVTGKGLSTNDYTTAEKTKLAGIATGAEVNVQSDWDETDTTSDAYIKNKPTIPAGVTVDSALDSTSENPVQNKVIKAAIDAKADDADFTGATSSASGTHGLVPEPAYDSNRNDIRVLMSDAAWAALTLVSVYGSDGSLGLTLNRYSNGTTTRMSKVTLEEATSSMNGLMPKSDKTKLDSLIITNGVIDPSNLPSYVDDVIEAYPRSGQTELSSTWLATGSASGTVITPETGKIYILMADSTSYAAESQFRWSGTAYVKMMDGGVSSITNAEIDTIVAS